MAWHNYDGMLPPVLLEGKRGYYPVCNAQEWEQLPDLYKAMEWSPVPDYRNKGSLSAVKSVIFDVVYLEPYRINAKVHIHCSDVQKVLYCLFKDSQCHLYTICGVELESGTQYGAKWLQDSTTGSFGVYAGTHLCGRQGGFQGFVPANIERLEDGTFKYRHYSRCQTGNKVSFEFSNPFPEERFVVKKPSLEEVIDAADRVANDGAGTVTREVSEKGQER